MFGWEAINSQRALELLLLDKYRSEFEVIDGLNQHPKGMNFNKWLLDNGLITEFIYGKLEELNEESHE